MVEPLLQRCRLAELLYRAVARLDGDSTVDLMYLEARKNWPLVVVCIGFGEIGVDLIVVCTCGAA